MRLGIKMTNIIERLRNPSTPTIYSRDAMAMRHAADTIERQAAEIERLKAALESLGSQVCDTAKMEAEIERLKADLEHQKDDYKRLTTLTDNWRKEALYGDRRIHELNAELEQLRKAQGEPVAWIREGDSRAVVRSIGDLMDKRGWIPCYTHPAPEQVEQLKAEIERLKVAQKDWVRISESLKQRAESAESAYQSLKEEYERDHS